MDGEIKVEKLLIVPILLAQLAILIAVVGGIINVQVAKHRVINKYIKKRYDKITLTIESGESRRVEVANSPEELKKLQDILRRLLCLFL